MSAAANKEMEAMPNDSPTWREMNRWLCSTILHEHNAKRKETFFIDPSERILIHHNNSSNQDSNKCFSCGKIFNNTDTVPAFQSKKARDIREGLKKTTSELTHL